MRLFQSLANLASSLIDVVRVQTHLATVLLRHPTLTVQRPSVWRFDRLEAIEIGRNVFVGPFTEIIVFHRTVKSSIPGRLILKDGAKLSAGCNIRAAGGTISIGENTMVAQGVSLVAVNHSVVLGEIYTELPWDEKRTGVTIGANCWIGANSAILPGVEIGDNAVIGAGSIVTKSVPQNQIWAGVPAKFLRNVD